MKNWQFCALTALLWACLVSLHASPKRNAESCTGAIEKINAAYVKKPGTKTEVELVKEIPLPVIVRLAGILREKSNEQVVAALMKCGKAALDLPEMDHF